MLVIPLLTAFLVIGNVQSVQMPMDWTMLYKQPQAATTIAKNYVVGALSKPLANIRNTVCSAPHMDEAMMRTTLNRAADSVINKVTETTGKASQEMQNVMSYVSDVAKEFVSSPSFQPQVEALQNQFGEVMDYLSEKLGDTFEAVNKNVKM